MRSELPGTSAWHSRQCPTPSCPPREIANCKWYDCRAADRASRSACVEGSPPLPPHEHDQLLHFHWQRGANYWLTVHLCGIEPISHLFCPLLPCALPGPLDLAFQCRFQFPQCVGLRCLKRNVTPVQGLLLHNIRICSTRCAPPYVCDLSSVCLGPTDFASC